MRSHRRKVCIWYHACSKTRVVHRANSVSTAQQTEELVTSSTIAAYNQNAEVAVRLLPDC